MCRMGCSVSDDSPPEPEPEIMVLIKKCDLERFIKHTCEGCDERYQRMRENYRRHGAYYRPKGCWAGCYVHQYKELVK